MIFTFVVFCSSNITWLLDRIRLYVGATVTSVYSMNGSVPQKKLQLCAYNFEAPKSESVFLLCVRKISQNKTLPGDDLFSLELLKQKYQKKNSRVWAQSSDGMTFNIKDI